MNSTGEQDRAVQCPIDHHCMVSAGPGSGKTYFLVLRALKILNEVKSAKIYCLSFTNESARELRRRIAGLSEGNVQVSTIHRFCLNGLNSLVSDGQRLKVVKVKSVLVKFLKRALSVEDRRAILQLSVHEGIRAPVADEDDSDFEEPTENVNNDTDETISDSEAVLLSKLIDCIRSFKRGAFDPENLPAFLPELARKYTQILREESIVDLSLIVTEFVQNFFVLRDYVKSVCKYLLIDEFQDLDREQLKLIQLLVNEGVKITAVGDANQSIYGWRRTECESKRCRIDFFESGNYQSFRLALNMRSAPHIVRLANGLVQADGIPNRPQRGIGCALMCRSEIEEELKIAQILKSNPERLSSCAVLFRYNADKERFLKIIEKQNISFHGRSATSIPNMQPKTKSLEVLLSILNAVVGDSSALVSALLTTTAGKANSEALTSFLIDNGVIAGDLRPILIEERTMLERLRELTSSSSTNLRCKGIISSFMSKLTKVDRPHSVVDKLSAILTEFKVKRTKDVTDILVEATARSGIQDLVGHRSRMEADEIRKRMEAKGVFVGTIHASKGREWKTVFVPHVNEGTLPGENSDINEERRILYVAITRAVESILITCCSKTGIEPSRFLMDTKISTTCNVNEVISALRNFN